MKRRLRDDASLLFHISKPNEQHLPPPPPPTRYLLFCRRHLSVTAQVPPLPLSVLPPLPHHHRYSTQTLLQASAPMDEA